MNMEARWVDAWIEEAAAASARRMDAWKEAAAAAASARWMDAWKEAAAAAEARSVDAWKEAEAEDVHHVFTGIDRDEDEDYFARFSVADDDNHDDCIGNDRRDSSAPIPLELVKGVCYAKSYQLRRGDLCSGDVHYHKMVVNAARDAFYVDGVKKSMDVPQNKSFLEVSYSYENGSPVEGKNVGRHVNDRLQQTYTIEQDGIHFAPGVIGLSNVDHFPQNSMDSTMVLDDILSDKTFITGSAKISASLNEGRLYQFFNVVRNPSRDMTSALRGLELKNSQEALDVSSTPRPLVGDNDGYSHTICAVAIQAHWVIFATDSRVTSGGATVPQVIHDTVRKYYTFGPYYVLVTGGVMVAAAVLSRFRDGINMRLQESEVRLRERAWELHMHLQFVMAQNNIRECSNEFLIGSVEMSNGQFTEVQVYRVHQKGVNKRSFFHAIGSGIAYMRDLAENSGWDKLEIEVAKKKVVEVISVAVHNDATCGGALDIVSVKISNGELEQDVLVIDLGEMCRNMGISDRSPKLPSPFNNNTEVRRSINLNGGGFNILTQDEFLENVFQL